MEKFLCSKGFRNLTVHHPCDADTLSATDHHKFHICRHFAYALLRIRHNRVHCHCSWRDLGNQISTYNYALQVL